MYCVIEFAPRILVKLVKQVYTSGKWPLPGPPLFQDQAQLLAYQRVVLGQENMLPRPYGLE